MFLTAPVEHVHGVVGSLHRQDGRLLLSAALVVGVVEKVPDVLGVDGGGGDDQSQVPPLAQDLFQQTHYDVDLGSSFVHLFERRGMVGHTDSII